MNIGIIITSKGFLEKEDATIATIRVVVCRMRKAMKEYVGDAFLPLDQDKRLGRGI